MYRYNEEEDLKNDKTVKKITVLNQVSPKEEQSKETNTPDPTG